MKEIFIKYFRGECSSEEKEFIFKNMDVDEEARKEFFDLQCLYSLLSARRKSSDEIFALRSLRTFKRRRSLKESVRLFKIVTGYAAVIAVLVVATFFVSSSYHKTDKGLLIYKTPAGQRANLTMSDGTNVWLNASTTLKYPVTFEGNERRVQLDGEAFFVVTHNAKRPFIVETHKADVRVLGTKFNVYAYASADQFSTFLEEGSVMVTSKKGDFNAVELNPDEQIDILGDQVEKKKIVQCDFLLWRDGIYTFDDVSFDKIIDKLELYYDIEIKVCNEKLKAFKFSGKFRQRDGIENVLRAMQKVYRFSFLKDDEMNILTIK